MTTPITTSRARGIYYWETESNLFIVHDASVFEATQDSVAIGSISSGTERVTILETIGTKRLVILDAENNEGWWVNTPASAVTAIASNFPSTICHGGAILDGYLFVMDEDGVIYNSDVDDPTTFGASSFLEAERENDKGVYLGKHHDHLVAFGTRTIEFFYDAGNSTGSPLNRRQDISYRIGCASGLGVWEHSDVIYFMGSDDSGQIRIYRLVNFQLEPVSNDTLNSYLTQGLTQEGLYYALNGFAAMGHNTLILTVYTITGSSPGDIVPKESIVLDELTGFLSFWDTAVAGLSEFPCMAFTKRTGGFNATAAARTGEGIMHNGDIFNINDNLVPIDTLLGSDGVYAADTYEVDIYVATSTSSGENISAIIRTGQQSFGTYTYKFENSLQLTMENLSAGETMTVKTSDNVNSNFITYGTLNLDQERKEIHVGGRFVKRNYQLEYSGAEQFFIDAMDVDVDGGD